jgi:hypothetical protein
MKSAAAYLALVFLCLVPVSSHAQTSIGFKNPDDISTLLDYRLPDWGYRTLFLNFDFVGQGHDGPLVDNSNAELRQSLDFTRYGESEDRFWLLEARQRLNWDWNEDTDSLKTTAARFNGGLTLSAELSEYLSDDFFWTGSVSLSGDYNESRSHDVSGRDADFRRSFVGSLEPGIGIGQIRDVTPILRAMRINERLRALGRTELPPEDVHGLAEVFARSEGYFAVFDRSDRHFWQDMLEPFVGSGEPLSPFEVLYLRESSFEQLGSRQEGALASAGIELSRTAAGGREPRDELGPWVEAAWSHNLDLNHQISSDFESFYLWNQRPEQVSIAERGQASLTGSYLWVLADRVVWNNSLAGRVEYLEEESGAAATDQTVSWTSRCEYYVEDHVSLVPRIVLQWERRKLFDMKAEDHRDWRVEFAINYNLGRALY